MIEHFYTVMVLTQSIPNPAPVEPPGAKEIVDVVGNIKWLAGIALLVGFFAGLAVWAGGRWIDHHRAGRVGLVMMLCAVGGGLLYAVGWQMISHFAGTT